MKTIVKAFTEHPESVNETYFEHLKMAFGFGARMILGGLACIMHGLFPFMCLKTGSNAVTKLHTTMVTHRDKSIRVDSTEAMSPLAKECT